MTVLPVVLPQGFTSTVSLQTSVKPGEIIATKTQSLPLEKKIPIASFLAVPSRTAGKYLKKNPGDSISIGDVVAQKKSLFGLSKTDVKSQIAGVVSRYERDTGTLILSALNTSTEGNAETITAPVEGVVTDITEQKILIKTNQSVLQATAGIGESAQAELVCTDPSIEDVFYQLDSKTSGKLVLLPVVTKDIVMKAIGIGVKGLITQDITHADYAYIMDKTPDYPLVKVEKSVYDILNAQKGRTIFLHGKEKVLILI